MCKPITKTSRRRDDLIINYSALLYTNHIDSLFCVSSFVCGIDMRNIWKVAGLIRPRKCKTETLINGFRVDLF